MSTTAMLPMRSVTFGVSVDWSRLLIRQAIAHALWKIESHRVGGPVHGNDWDHWFEARSLVEVVLAERVKQRAYFLWKDECNREKHGVAGEPRHFWRLAEGLERSALFWRVAEAAHYRWLNECRMMGCIVHGNDWYHWFAAEREVAVALADELDPIFFSYNEHQVAAPKQNRLQRGGAKTVGVDNCSAMDGHAESLDDPRGSTDGFSKEGVIIMDRKTPNPTVPETTAECRLSIIEAQETDSSDFSDRVCWTIDLTDSKFRNKVVATDRHVTEVLAIADSLEELAEIMGRTDFRKTLHERFDDECLVHSGPVG